MSETNNQRDNHVYINIINVTLPLLCQKGYYGIKISEISELININEFNFFDYFNSKDDLVLAVVDHVVKYCRQFIFSITRNNNQRENIGVFYRTFEYYFTNHYSYHLLMSLLALELDHERHSQIYRKINDYFAEWEVVFYHVIKPSCAEKPHQFINNVAKHCLAESLGKFLLNHIENKYRMVDFSQDCKVLIDSCIQQTKQSSLLKTLKGKKRK